jgi:hypothetical protein
MKIRDLITSRERVGRARRALTGLMESPLKTFFCVATAAPTALSLALLGAYVAFSACQKLAEEDARSSASR